MLSGNNDVDRVREATDLLALIGEHMALKQRGREFVGLCPFHDDHSPSLSVVTHKGDAFYKCHACGAAGDALRFVMDYHKLEFPEALRFLADRAGITLEGRREPRTSSGPSRGDLRQINTRGAAHFRRNLADPKAGTAARTTLQDRGIDATLAEQFGVGLALPGYDGLLSTLRDDRGAQQAAVAAGLLRRRDDGRLYDAFRNRLVFPICDELGTIIAFGGRRLDPDDEPKYLNSPETALFSKSKVLYGLHLAKRSIIESNVVVVTEGYTDVIACHRAGIGNVVGTLGTALTREHARLLSRLCNTVVLVFDGDEAGQRAADRGVQVFFHEPVDVRICVLPDGQDPDDLLRRPDGAELFRQAVSNASDAMAYKLDRFRAALGDQRTIAGREKLLDGFLRELVDLGFTGMTGVRKRLVMSRLAELLGVSIRDIEQSLPRERPQRGRADQDASPSSTGDLVTNVARARQLAEHQLLSVVLRDPSLGCQPVDQDQSGATTICGIFSADDFQDPRARAICGFVFARLAEGLDFTMAQLLGVLDDPRERELASRLALEGHRRLDGADEPSGPVALREAVEALRSCIDHERYQKQMTSRPSQAGPERQVQVLEELLEERRRRGDIASAIPQGIRS
jgi:DNA primase